jgi:digeranylgeranylglycerophospholipid reductase
MIEKRQEIGSPVRCGEGISLEWISDYGIEKDDRWLIHEVDGARIISPGGHRLDINPRMAGNEVGATIRRDFFDQTLAEMAADAGADIMVKTYATELIREGDRFTGIKARCNGEDCIIRAKAIIGADGFESQIARWAGLSTVLKQEDIATNLQYHMVGIDIDPKFSEFYLGSLAKGGGYAWIFPKGEDSANVGIGVTLNMIKEGGHPKRLLEKFIDKNPGLKKGKVIEVVAGVVSVSAPADKTVKDNLMIVGDAARMADAITGGGIKNAVRSGAIAGEVAAKSIQSGNLDDFMDYEKRWRSEFEDELFRDWMAKNKMMTLSDEDFDILISTLAESNIENLSVYEILEVIQDRLPHLVEELMSFM